MADKKPAKVTDDLDPTRVRTKGRMRSSSSAHVNDKQVQAMHQAEQAAARLRAYNDMLLTHTSDWAIRLDARGKIRAASPSTLKLLGYVREELVGRFLADLLAPTDKPACKQFLAEVVRQSGLVPFRWQVQTMSGRLLSLVGVGQAFPHPQSKEQEVECLARPADHDDLLKSERPTPEHFGFMLAHELNQPLTGVVTAARAGVRLLLQDQADRAELMEVLDLAATQAEHAAFIIRGLRQLSIGKGPGRSWIELGSWIHDCLRHSPLPREENGLELTIAADFPKIFVDPILLGVVIINLVKNALEAMRDIPPSDRRLVIEASCKQNQAVITLRDAGPGFPPGQVERGWRPFQSSKTQGMGLGLPLSRWIVEAHGGRLTVDPSSTQGTVFHITLPLGEESHENEKSSAQCLPR